MVRFSDDANQNISLPFLFLWPLGEWRPTAEGAENNIKLCDRQTVLLFFAEDHDLSLSSGLCMPIVFLKEWL